MGVMGDGLFDPVPDSFPLAPGTSAVCGMSGDAGRSCGGAHRTILLAYAVLVDRDFLLDFGYLSWSGGVERAQGSGGDGQQGPFVYIRIARSYNEALDAG